MVIPMKTTHKLQSEIADGMYRRLFLLRYGERDCADAQKRISEALKSFEKYYGIADVAVFRAPARVTLAGAFTEVQGGKVLEMAVNREILAVVSESLDGMIRIYSEEEGLSVVDPLRPVPREEEQGTTTAIVKGVAHAFKRRGYQVGGFYAFLSSTIPANGSYGKAAATEMLAAEILSELYNDSKLGTQELASIAQEAENTYYGHPSGVADQLAVGTGGFTYIDFSQEEPEVHPLSAPFENQGLRLALTELYPQTYATAKRRDDFAAAMTRELHRVSSLLGGKRLAETSISEVILRAEDLRNEVGEKSLLHAMYFLRESRRVRELLWLIGSESRREEFLRSIKDAGEEAYRSLYTPMNLPEGGRYDAEAATALTAAETVLNGHGAAMLLDGGTTGVVLAFVENEAFDRYRAAMDGLFGEDSTTEIELSEDGVVRLF